MLQARAPDDQGRLGAAGGGGAADLRCGPGQWSDAAGPRGRVAPLVVHVKPVGVPQPDYGARHVAALVLLVEPGHTILVSIPPWWPGRWG